jgi:O-antigen/teichoic acid export membrane protein
MTMAAATFATPPARRLTLLWLTLASPAVAMFLSSNVANAGNLVFNMLFSRWMGPELFADLATLLTLKLALLALLNAVQMAVSQDVSAERGTATDGALVWVNRVVFLALAAAVPFVVPGALTGAIGAHLGVTSDLALAILIFALPVTAPLCIARGVAVGRLEVGRIVLSANLEMVVRLGGGILAWKAGLGIEGVIGAVAASLVVGWLPVRGALRIGKATGGAAVARRIALLAFPFAVLQASQVVHLDGDVLVANAFLSSADTGLVAVLSLFQRMQFFACFGLAAVLLPSVTLAVARGGSGFREAMPVGVLFLAVSVPFVALLGAAPTLVITLLVGPEFAAAADALALAGLCAALFTLSYLGATFLAALGDRRGIWLTAAFAPVQLGAYAWLGLSDGGMDLGQMVVTKVACQAVLTSAILGLVLIKARRPATRLNPQYIS